MMPNMDPKLMNTVFLVVGFVVLFFPTAGWILAIFAAYKWFTREKK